MHENKDQQIGIRFTKTEREIIETLASNRSLSLAEFIRSAIFSHINHLEEDIGILNVDVLMKQIDNINKSIEKVIESITVMKKEINIFDLKKIQHNLGINGSIYFIDQSKLNFTEKIEQDQTKEV